MPFFKIQIPEKGNRFLPVSPLLGAASFAGWTGFDTVSYIGAFDGSNNWMSGWTNFDPQNAKY